MSNARVQSLKAARQPISRATPRILDRLTACRAFTQLVDNFREVMPELTDADVRRLATFAMAGADGLFIAKEIDGDAVDLVALFELHGHAIYDTALRLARTNTAQTDKQARKYE